MRKVMIAAPSYDGTITVWHASSLSETCKLGFAHGVNVFAIYMSYDSLVQRARNDIIQLALEQDVDDLVFIDCDIDWTPADFFKLLEHDVDVVGGIYPKKGDHEEYPVKALNNVMNFEKNGLIEVEGIATGFLRLTKRAIQKVWENSEEYTEPHKPKPIRMVFNIDIVNGQLVSEDIIFCMKWRELGEKVWFDPSINLSHVGTKRWNGNFLSWLEKIKQ
jgi:glycosyltransferase involved in cell wall biosynthesis